LTDQLINPITLAFTLLDQYRGFLRTRLEERGLSPNDVETIMASVDVDRGLYLSINRKYQSGTTSFMQFCQDQSIAPQIPDALTRISDLHAHQEAAIEAIREGRDTIVATGTGSGKTEAFLVPILDYCLKHPEPGLKAIIIYPMNALANDQIQRMERTAQWIQEHEPELAVTIRRFTGETDEAERREIRRSPPDILITNYVMLDWMLTRAADATIFNSAARHLNFIVLDEIHTYRGNKASHLRQLLARLKARLTRRPIHIGTSATLQRDGDDRAAVDAFIHALFDTTDYALVEPRYEPEGEPESETLSLPVPKQDADLGWAMIPESDEAIRSLGALLDTTYSEFDMLTGAEPPRPYTDLQRNPFLQAARNRLIEGGAQSFVSLVALMKTLMGPEHRTHTPEDLVRAYLSAVAHADFRWSKEQPSLLDYRLHLLVREISGYLKRCPRCGAYHAGDQVTCQDCGAPLFCVYRRDPRWCIGKISGRRLRAELERASDDPRSTFYVLISSTAIDLEADGADDDSVLHFRESLQPDGEEIEVIYDEAGEMLLKFLPVVHPRDIEAELVPLDVGNRQHPYLHALVQALLDALPQSERKLLAFVDNRERALRYAAVLQEAFADRYLKAFMALHTPTGRTISPLDTWQILQRSVPPAENLSAVEKALFDELELWFWRLLGAPPRLSGDGANLLTLRDPDAYSETERTVLQIFINERALLKPSIGEVAAPALIRFRHDWALDRRGIYIDENGSSDDPNYPSISLSRRAREYDTVVRELSSEVIASTIEDLVARGVLCAGTTPDAKQHFYLKPEYLSLNVGDSAFDDYQQLKDALLLTARAHSSEVSSRDREEIEKDFKDGVLNCVIATPTLEMGIDIGDLKNVLMIGAPPLPSNYVQRAGRAGRGGRQHALITTLCHAGNDHDAYTFDHPKELIDGAIAPPRFNPANPEVIKKHVNAYMLAGRAEHWSDLDALARDLFREIPRRKDEVARIFGEATVAAEYLTTDFAGELGKMRNLRRSHPRQVLYREGYFPDYAFRRDQVYLVDSEQRDIELSETQVAEFALAEREPEQAYYRFSPGEQSFFGKGLYTITSKGAYEAVALSDDLVGRQYRYQYADRETRYASPDKTHIKYDREMVFEYSREFRSLGKVLDIAFAPACPIIFVNRGRLGDERTEPFREGDEAAFALAHRMVRPALILGFPLLVCEDPRVPLSLTSALHRAINEKYNLDESEVKIMLGAAPAHRNDDEPAKYWVILYEADGNGNVPLARAHAQFEQLLAEAYERMRDCEGLPGQACETGCYQCTRSYALRHVTGGVDKQTALMFIGYLLGKNRFHPSIRPPERRLTAPDLILTVKKRQGGWYVQGPSRTYSADDGESQNQAIFDLLTQIVQAEHAPDMHTIEIRSNTYVRDAIGCGHIKKDQESFARLMLNLMRFEQVTTAKEPA
jgi:Lhr-like helicase